MTISGLRKGAACAVILLATLTQGTKLANAQPSDKDQDAERLFREGQKAMEDRRYGEACPKFEAAYKKDQQLGTLLNLAYCHKEQGAIWQAWLEFKEAELKANELHRSDRREFAKQKMVELEKEKTLGRVMIEQTSKVDLTEVLVEDHRIPEAEKSIPFVAEVGPQRKFTFRAKGKKDKILLVNLARSAQPQRVTVPDMVDEPKEVVTAPPVDTTPKEPPPKESPPPGEDKGDNGSSQKTVAYALAGVGLAAVAVGTIAGVSALNSICRNGNNRPETGCTADEDSSGKRTALISTIAFPVGGAALTAGLVLWLLAPSGSGGGGTKTTGAKVTPLIGLGWAGVNGAF